MTVIKVLGSGCGNCTQTQKLIEKVAAKLGLDARIEKETDLATIVQYGALATPGVVIDEKLVHTGGIPSAAQVRAWLTTL